jgi:outer membrane protein assembly factor BamB
MPRLASALLAACAFLPAAALASAHALPDTSAPVSEAEAWHVGWPALHGPQGNLVPLRTGLPLVENLAEAGVAWISEDADLGSAKTGSQTFKSTADVERRLGPDAKLTPGNWAGVIVAENRVFASSFRAAGPVFTATRLAGKNQPEVAPFRFRLDAEDLVLALDAHSGRTLWRTVEPGGWIRSGGKREGFQVTPAYAEGRVFAMGSTGRLFAYEAATGRRLWQSDIGPAHAAAARAREAALAAATAGRFTEPDSPAWHTSLVATRDVLVAPTYAFAKGAPNDTGLAGFSAATGEKLWEVPAACSRHATPALWWHDGRPYLLSATWTGRLRLIDPADGRVLWTLDGLGPTPFTLGPSATHVMVNIAPKPDPKIKRHPGRWGAVRLSLEGGSIAWSLPEEPAFQIPTWFDSCARQRAFIRDGRVYLSTEGDKSQNAPGAFLLLDEATGAILARHENSGPESDQVTGLFYLFEDRLLVRADNAHGASHGGRNPLLAWSVAPGAVRRLGSSSAPSGFDPHDFTTAYEVFMELPVVAGRVFERTADGRVACYDFRRPEKQSRVELQLINGFVGLTQYPFPLTLLGDSAADFRSALSLPPSDAQAGLPYGRERRGSLWTKNPAALTRAADGALVGDATLALGSSLASVALRLPADSDTGSWTRVVPPLASPREAQGGIGGRGPFDARSYLTPWLADRPITTYGTLPAGTRSHIVVLENAITLRAKPASLHLALDHDGRAFVRSVATAFSFNQSWHEIDASALRLAENRITGDIRVVLHPDAWVSPRGDERGQVAGRLTLDATLGSTGWTGTFTGVWGVAAEFSGEVRVVRAD